MTDPELLDAWRAGDATAGEALFKRYYGLVSRFFANKVSSDPADLIQDTFMGCLRGRERLRDDAGFRKYVFGVAYNVLHEHYRTLHGNRFDPQTTSCADVLPGPGTMMAKGDEQGLLLAALRRLPLPLQVVLELFYWEDMTSSAIAEIMGEPHGTIRTRLRRARELLGEAIAGLGAEPGLVHRTATDLDGWAAQVRAAVAS